ncbi:MAG: nitrogenase component 1 [archaeon]|nr:nitrogenase component 1 [archaeon]
MNTEADGFMGVVMAAQSVKGLKALINGPGGCRSRAMNLLRETLMEYRGEDSDCCGCRYMSRVSMLPCTYLNADDIILGSGAKIADGIREVVRSSNADVVLIDTLGATVQVVDREQAVRDSGQQSRVILAHQDLSDLSFEEGFDDTIVRILDFYCGGSSVKVPRRVNILGYTQMDRDWFHGRQQILDLLHMIGIEEVCFIGCDSCSDELRKSAGAELNILIHPELCIATAEWYLSEHGVPYLIPTCGSPVGYEAIRGFLREVSERLGLDCTEALSLVDDEEGRVCRIIKNHDKVAWTVRGSSMHAAGYVSDILPMTRLLYDYLNIVPRSVRILGSNRVLNDGRLESFLIEIGHPDALQDPHVGQSTRIYLSDGYDAARFAESHREVACVDVMHPHVDRVTLSDRCLIGLSGTRNLLDEVLNGLDRFTCGQPTAADFR